jgi:hypothetical protein
VSEDICAECGRPRPQPTPSIPTAAVTYCGACHVPFSLDEIGAIFHEMNMSDSNIGRQLRQVIVDDLIAALRAEQAVKVTP